MPYRVFTTSSNRAYFLGSYLYLLPTGTVYCISISITLPILFIHSEMSDKVQVSWDEDAVSVRGDKENESKKNSGRKKSLTAKTVFEEYDGDDNRNTNGDDEDQSRSKCCGVKSPGKGIIDDFKQTIGKNWWKEMTNFNSRTVAVSFFLFFAAIAPAITFGAIYSKVTHNYIGGKYETVTFYV